MTDRKPAPSRPRQILVLLLKTAVTIACLWFVASKISFTELKAALLPANPFWLGLAIVAFIVSKTVASYRLNIYFRNISLNLSERENLKLFWLGMFYNLFLPGSITGDAYKVILLSRRFGVPYKKTSAAVLLDRFSGLLAIGLIISGYAFFVLPEPWQAAGLGVLAIAAVFISLLIIQRWFKDFIPGFWPAFFLGLAVQFLMVLTVHAILLGLDIPGPHTVYIFIFLVAVVASVLPLTVGGGLGIREFVFYKGAVILGADEHVAVVVSLVFYFVTLLVSLAGGVFIFKKIFNHNHVQSGQQGSVRMNAARLKRRLLNTGANWISFIQLLPELLRLNKKSLVLDCGANVGFISRLLSYTGARVISFEPDPAAFRKLVHRCRKRKNVTCIQKGVWDSDATGFLYRHKLSMEGETDFSVGSSIIAEKKTIDTGKKQVVELVDLTRFLQSLPQPPDLVKMDVEGAEIDILKKIIATDTHRLFRKMYVETHVSKIPSHKKELEAIRRQLKEKGIRNIKLTWI